jgi:hypothetical protein
MADLSSARDDRDALARDAGTAASILSSAIMRLADTGSEAEDSHHSTSMDRSGGTDLPIVSVAQLAAEKLGGLAASRRKMVSGNLIMSARLGDAENTARVAEKSAKRADAEAEKCARAAAESSARAERAEERAAQLKKLLAGMCY